MGAREKPRPLGFCGNTIFLRKIRKGCLPFLVTACLTYPRIFVDS